MSTCVCEGGGATLCGAGALAAAALSGRPRKRARKPVISETSEGGATREGAALGAAAKSGRARRNAEAATKRARMREAMSMTLSGG